MNPTVSFIVPCYNLAHLLGECIESILAQTFHDFEILIMDDCSPDHTEQIAHSFPDRRIRYIRNPKNLGHLRNYNKGIELSRGKYVWLVSADDRLTSPRVLEKFVRVLDAHPEVGYACCSGVEIREENQLIPAKYSVQSNQDRIFAGEEFLERLLYSNFVIASSGMVRKTCYENFGVFPLDLPYAGDWYLWCLFALHHDVAYFSEPMVGYRVCGQSMTDAFVDAGAATCASDDLAVLWRIDRKAEEAHKHEIECQCRRAIAYEYARQLLGKRYRGYLRSMTLQECEASIARYAAGTQEIKWLRARIYGSVGDISFQSGDFRKSQDFYSLALRQQFWLPKLWVKILLLRTGGLGMRIRRRRTASFSHV